MSNELSLEQILEGELETFLSVSMADPPQANGYSCGSVPLIEQDQDQPLLQFSGAPFDLSPSQDPLQQDPFALPPLEDTAWNEFIQDAGQLQSGDPFDVAAAAMTVDDTFAFWDNNYPGDMQEDVALPDQPISQARRPAFSAPDQFEQANTAIDEISPTTHQQQQSPNRPADGTAAPTTQFQNKHDRVYLRVKCFPCFTGKRKCDRENQPNGICSECAHRATRFPDIFDATGICVTEETQAFKDFKAARVGHHGKAKALGDDDWGARKQARQEKKAAKKN